MTIADKIRQMTNDELARFLVIQALMGGVAATGVTEREQAEESVRELVESKSGEDDIRRAKEWLRQEWDSTEVDKDAGTD